MGVAPVAPVLSIDVVVPTFNRARLLSRMLQSIRQAHIPPNLIVRTIIVDNNSTDDTRQVVEAARADWNGALIYRFEPVQSRSAALNNGLEIADADLIGMIDDDEEIDREWFAVIERSFRDPKVDFISGPYQPRWGATPPGWLPPPYRGVIGWMDAGPRRLQYGKDFSGVMCGGNAVVRTALGRSVGWYNPALGREGLKIGSGCEDVDFFQRLMAAGAVGYYLPELIIYHYIPPSRLTKRYHREWVFRRSTAQARVDGLRPQPVAHLLGVPRYLIGTAARSAKALVASAFTGRWNSAEAFSSELSIWELAGYLRGAVGRRTIQS